MSHAPLSPRRREPTDMFLITGASSADSFVTHITNIAVFRHFVHKIDCLVQRLWIFTRARSHTFTLKIGNGLART